MMNTRKHNAIRMWARRSLAGVLALVLLCGSLPMLASSAQPDSLAPDDAAEAASAESSAESASEYWAQQYLDKLVDWGVMRGDENGALHPESNITRAELVAMINRAYGYDRKGEIPFVDVTPNNWYYDDIAIAYNVGYFTGTSENTASPDLEVTREQAVVLLARNMMLKSEPGETLGFTDSRDFSGWSHDLIQPAVQAGIITGDPSGTFRPKDSVTRAEIASMLTKAIGTPVQTEGESNLGSVYGNVTISDSNVTLKDTVIAGDLYLTGGIGLGNVTLENVTVLGRIVASGAGESHKGDSSIILRNVTADQMVVDSISNQLVSVRSEGDTIIGLTSVRTPAYLEDQARDNFGLKTIELDGESGIQLSLAGNIKEVINRTPESNLVMGAGTAQMITIDETAVGSTMAIENGAVVKTLNLDTSTSVTGSGDIETLNSNANGSTVEMLPDNINVRPGTNSNIAGAEMDKVAGEESSSDPRLLAGFPAVRDIAPTSAIAAFSVNKIGTIYWAVSAVTDGSIDEADVISPPSYGGRIIQSGKIDAKASGTEYTAQLSGLSSDGSFYLTAVMIDERGKHSPVKVTSFSTPDSTVPAFAKGYPVLSKITNSSAQVTAMTNKNCLLYYALLPKDSTAPIPQDFKTNAISGNLGYGSIDAVKNNTIPFTANSIDLEEMKSYDLYLWLTDYDGAQSAKNVTKLSFTTTDGTPPVISHLEQSDAKASNVEITFAMNEPGTLYWAVVKEGGDFLRPLAGQAKVPELTDEAAKIQVENGMGAISKGASKVSKANTDIKFSISKLQAQTAYDLYYVAKDAAGNYSASVVKLTVNTLDNVPPTVTQEFTKLNQVNEGEEADPLAETDIRLVFSESVGGMSMAAGERVYSRFIDLYQTVLRSSGEELDTARSKLAAELRQHIELYQKPAVGQPVKLVDREQLESEDEPWVIDFRYATVTMEEDLMIITLENNKGINLSSGATYYFTLTDITDTSSAHNVMRKTSLPNFTTVFAQVFLEVADTYQINNNELNSPTGTTDPNLDPTTNSVRIDMGFKMTPQSEDKVDPSMMWDLLLWTDTSMTYTLYSRAIGDQLWEREGEASINVSGASDGFAFTSLTRQFRTVTGEPVFQALRDMEDREFGIHVNKIGDSSNDTAWNCEVNLKVTVAASSQFALNNLSRGSYIADWNKSVQSSNTSSIGLPDPFIVTKTFSDTVAPQFVDKFPSFKVGDIAAEVEVMIDRPGTVYYVAVPITPLDPAGTADVDITDYTCAVLPAVVDREHVANKDGKPLPAAVPESGAGGILELSSPGVTTITSGRFTGEVRYGVSEEMEANNATTIQLENLNPDTMYYIYMVTKGTSAIYSDYALCYRFRTSEAERPLLTLDLQNPSVNVTVDRNSFVSYVLVSASAGVLGLDDPFNTVAKPTTDAAYLSNSYTILDALSNDHSNGGSVFDQFATDAAKEQMANRIRNATPDSSTITIKEVDKAMNGTQGIDCTKGLIGDGYFIFVAMARSQLGSSNSYRAIRPVQQKDDEPPVIISCVSQPDYSSFDFTSDYAAAFKQSYSGSVVITFNEPLYYRVQSNLSQNITPIEHTSQSSDPNYNPLTAAFIPLKSICTLSSALPGSNFQLSSEVPGQTTNVMRFTYEKLYAGATIDISPGLCDKGGATHSEGALQIQLTLVKNKDDYYIPTFTFLPSIWDGRE